MKKNYKVEDTGVSVTGLTKVYLKRYVKTKRICVYKVKMMKLVSQEKY